MTITAAPAEPEENPAPYAKSVADDLFKRLRLTAEPTVTPAIDAIGPATTDAIGKLSLPNLKWDGKPYPGYPMGVTGMWMDEAVTVNGPVHPADLFMRMTKAPESPSKVGQVGGNHYEKMAIQPFQFSMANGLDPMQHTVIKYVTRFRDKNGVQDLKKARHVIDMLIEHELNLLKGTK